MGVSQFAQIGTFDDSAWRKLWNAQGARTRQALVHLYAFTKAAKNSSPVRMKLPQDSKVLTELRRLKDSPFRIDRVVKPWETIHDLPEFNRSAFAAITQEIQQVTHSEDHQSRGVLILGEAGTGKTHLLARLFKQLSHDYHMLFVSAPANPDGIKSFTWTSVFESLQQTIPGESRTQCEDLLRRAFTNILLWSMEDPMWSGKNTDYWLLQVQRLGHTESLGDELETVRNRVLQAWAKRFPGDPIHQRFLQGLFNYLTYKDQKKRALLREWLTNYETDEDGLDTLGVDKWSKIEHDSSSVDLVSKRETWALKALETISQIATAANRPLILAFDQLEMMNGNLLLTREWGHAVKQIMDMANNLVVVTCIFPSLWTNWFRRNADDGRPALDDAAADRICGGGEIHLDPLSVTVADAIVRKRLGMIPNLDIAGATDTLFPREIVESMLDAIGGRRSLRSFLKACHERYNDIVYQSGPTPDEPGDLLSILDSAFSESASKRRLLGDADDHLVKRVEELVRVLYPAGGSSGVSVLPPKAFGKKVLPPHIVLRISGENRTDEIVIGLCSQGGQ